MMAPKKSTPTGIDPGYPQKNFVKAYYENRGQKDEYFKYMYGDFSASDSNQNDTALRRKASGYGHSIGQRAGKLRLSGQKGAHRIGKR